MGSLKTWIGGLISAAAGGMTSALGGYVADPKDFNIDSPDGLHKLGIAALFGVLVPVFAYLQKSPLPGDSSSN